MSQKKFSYKNLVSIIIPYYKKKENILKKINSILNQSYSYYEIIIIYDDDNLSELDYLEKLFKLEKKIKIIKNLRQLELVSLEIKELKMLMVNLLRLLMQMILGKSTN